MARSKSSAPRYKFARSTVSVRAPGARFPTTIHKGSAWHADCPMVLGHPHLFADDPPEVLPRDWKPGEQFWSPDAPVEAMTAAPGEKRVTGRD